MSNWSWDDLVNMRAYQPVERRAAEPEWQPHDPQDYRDRYPLAPDPRVMSMVNPARSTGIGGILESPPLAGPSRGVAAVIRGENPLRATADMTGASPELWEELQARGVNPLLALGAEVAVPSMLSVIGDVSDVADVGRWAASNWDNLAPLAASLFPASRMAWKAPLHTGWQTSLMHIMKNSSIWDGEHAAASFLGAIYDHMPGVERLDDEYIRIPSKRGSIEVVEHGLGSGALEVYVNGDIDPDDLARFIDLADAAEFQLITEGGSIPYEYARRLGFMEDELGGRFVRNPVDTDPPMWYAEMLNRLGDDADEELWAASGLVRGDIMDELSSIVARNPDLSPSEKEYWLERVVTPGDDPDTWNNLINDMTVEGIIPRIPGEDFEPRLVKPPVSGGGGGSGLVPTGGFDPGDYDPEQIFDWANKIKKAQEDAIRRGSPYSVEEWMRFFDVEGVRMPTGNPSEPLRPLTRDEVVGMHALLNGSMELPVELTTEQIADLIRSELGSPINPNEVRDFDRVLTGIQDNMLMQDNAISLLRSTDVELTPKIAGNVLESFFAIRPEDIGRTGDELIEWMDSVQRAYANAGRWSPDKPRYNVNEVLNRGLADLKILASRPTASGNTVADYDLLAAVRRMGSDADGLPRNLWDVVNDLHQIYPTVPLEQLESVAEMALL
jgi:hypothetical protein